MFWVRCQAFDPKPALYIIWNEQVVDLDNGFKSKYHLAQLVKYSRTNGKITVYLLSSKTKNVEYVTRYHIEIREQYNTVFNIQLNHNKLDHQGKD